MGSAIIITSKNIAFYLRLSQEDYDTGKLKEESNSIANQRKMLDDFTKGKKEFQSCDIREYCDDGYTGTNFNRPGFQRLRKDAACRKIDTIIIKDYSRLGRNFIGVGKYLEEEFPQMQIRVISINDGYDSNHEIDTANSISVPVKNLINEFYIKDLSKKVKSGIITRQKKGEYISANAIFGYKKSEEDIHKLVIDKETAFIVRKIFEYALEGKNSVQIANLLNQQNFKTPAWYKNKSDRRDYKIDEKTVWTSAKVMKIIRDRRYAGDMVGNMRVTTKIAKSDSVRVDRENWIVVEDTHEPIIMKEVFFKINEEIMPLKGRKDIPSGDSRRKGFCYCPHCGRVLQKSKTTVNPYLYCTRGKYKGNEECRNIMVNQKVLNTLLSEMVVVYIRTLMDVDEYVKRSKCKAMQNYKSEMSSADIDKEIGKLKQSTSDLYEKYRAGAFTSEEYLLQKKKVKVKIAELGERKLKILNGIGAKQEQEEWEQKLRDTFNTYKGKATFTERELSELIERVDVTVEGNLQVRWKFRDVMVKVRESLSPCRCITSLSTENANTFHSSSEHSRKTEYEPPYLTKAQ